MKPEHAPLIFPPIVAAISIVAGIASRSTPEQIATVTFIVTVLFFGPFWLLGSTIYWLWIADRMRENTARFEAGLMSKREEEAFLSGDYLVGRLDGEKT